MNAPTPSDRWQVANQRQLSARLGQVRAWLNRALGIPAAPLDAPLDAQPAETPLDEPLTAAPALASIFRLSEFETSLLLLCAGVEMDSAIAALSAELNGDPRRFAPTFGMALTALPGAHWSALAPGSPLRYWHLLEVGAGDTLAHAPLRVDERILHFLAGLGELDTRLAHWIRPAPPASLQTNGEEIEEAGRLARLLASGSAPLIQLCGGDVSGRLALAGLAAQQLGQRLFWLHASALPAGAEERSLAARLWQRETWLGGGLLLAETDGDAAQTAAISAFAGAENFPLIASSDWPLHLPGGRAAVRFQRPRPSTASRQETWQRALSAAGVAANGFVAALSAQFPLPPSQIQAAAQDALLGLAPEAGDAEIRRRLWDACRRQGRPHLDDLAQRIETRRAWEDIVLPETQKKMLHAIVAHAAQRAQVYERWGFGARSRGTGTSVVFAGPSGAGKTLAAEIIANELELDLYRVDLSGVVSKYIGETEKNLRRIFHAAENAGAILLFDEADALFGKRSEVKDSHDRYANIEVSYLLQQMEQARGLAILTTNLLEHFDRAFLRRVRFVVQFPFPGAAERAEIWRRVFPPEAPTAGLDAEKLARLNLTGGHIHNIALNGAFLAAEAQSPITMQHLRAAARFEFSKLERPLPEAELADWEAANA